MYPTESNQVLSLSLASLPAPFCFGQHPDFEKDFKEHRKRAHRYKKGGDLKELDETIMGRRISLSELADSRHPEVFIIPRNRFLCVVDEWNDPIGFERTIFPFSSTDFYVDRHEKEGSLFYELDHADPFFRLGGISQLGYLVPPRPEDWDKSVRVAYTVPQFFHTRWVHSLLAAILMEVILARNGFSKEERAPLVLTAGCHDIGTPAGGDSIKRVDPKGLDEEENFAWVLGRYGLAEKWAKQFGLDLVLAKEWVRNQGVFGRLLDVIDKMAYTALDCYYLGLMRPGEIKNLCRRYPLIMDVWQDIQFTPDRTRFFFTRPERLFRFLLLRAYEYQELLFNPYSRALDLFLKKLVKPLYKKGIITKEQLLTDDDKWLERVLTGHYPEEIKCYIEPEELSYKKFDTLQERKEYCKKFKIKVDHAERIAGFNTGLNWLTFKDGKVIPLRQAVSRAKIRLLKEVMASAQGYYVYYKRP